MVPIAIDMIMDTERLLMNDCIMNNCADKYRQNDFSLIRVYAFIQQIILFFQKNKS
jgi:hypothetical protein